MDATGQVLRRKDGQPDGRSTAPRLSRDEAREQREAAIPIATKLIQKGYLEYQAVPVLQRSTPCSRKAARKYYRLTQKLMSYNYAPTRGGKPDLRGLAVDMLATCDGLIQNDEIPPSVRLGAISLKCDLLGLKRILIEQTLKADVKQSVSVNVLVEMARKDERVRDLMVELSRRIGQVQPAGDQ
jgi:hypothetical protein